MLERYIPEKLASGDSVRVVAPSRSLSIISADVQTQAERTLGDMGLTVTYGDHVHECDSFQSSSVQSRVEDIHKAFSDTSVKAVLSVIGGYNSNQLLQYLDWELIRSNPKIFCGFSDIDALNNAISSKAGLVTYSGPVFSSFGQKRHFEYTREYFEKALLDNRPFRMESSDHWSDDQWFIDQEKRELISNDGLWVIQPGEANGRIVSSNLSTLVLLQGTEYFPDLANTVLFIEETKLSNPQMVDRNLQSLVQQKNFAIRGLILGRFQKGMMTKEQLIAILASKKELQHVPIVANADFGHTDPRVTIPIGGTVQLSAKEEDVTIEIIDH